MSQLNLSQAYSSDIDNNKNYFLPLTAMTVLFFLWGFITVLNDLLIPRLKDVFSLSYTEAMFIQLCFFGAYFIVSLPAGTLVKKVGYKHGVIIGLVIASVGCALFYPAAMIKEYWIFLTALFVLASGITILQVSANPYVAALGPDKTASSRLNLAQALNSLGTTLGPMVGSVLFFGGTSALVIEASSADSVKIPYLILAGALMTIAVLFSLLKLPEIHANENDDQVPLETASLFQAKHLIYGVFAIFCYVGAEVSIGSFLINFLGEKEIAGISESKAAVFISYYWGGAMVGRFIGAFIMRFVSPAKILLINSICVVALLTLTMSSTGNTAMFSVLAIGLFNSIMFPTIFTLAISGLGKQTSQASGWLCLAIVGGALVPLLQGLLADIFHLQVSFIVPALCYVFIIWYALNVTKYSSLWIKSIKD
ncbi:sugar MFS transporter [Pseudoalteromonas denitrificans]|uniref:MFS transporter, FHS family, L-fucose permease n=1 Tax=Pseudoalteromonas denitrificans DSM 6059 TaxID=1123010 RepID=A0A1I1GXE3_9GAMM|nr:sugar MFS transporter [Pseudoalteromonas denitrificans]SFC13843.1 MFS transporter, FHS family, L-fucose permease [Pseudoalteromonas denitrificans DSM 6059]